MGDPGLPKVKNTIAVIGFGCELSSVSVKIGKKSMPLDFS